LHFLGLSFTLAFLATLKILRHAVQKRTFCFTAPAFHTSFLQQLPALFCHALGTHFRPSALAISDPLWNFTDAPQILDVGGRLETRVW